MISAFDEGVNESTSSDLSQSQSIFQRADLGQPIRTAWLISNFLISCGSRQKGVLVLWVTRGLIPEKWTVEKCSSAQVKGAEGNEEKSVQ